jgi:hypothetical protein
MTEKLNLQHLRLMARIFASLPPGIDAPHAMIALEDVRVGCMIALAGGLSTDDARAVFAEMLAEAEALANPETVQ